MTEESYVTKVLPHWIKFYIPRTEGFMDVVKEIVSQYGSMSLIEFAGYFEGRFDPISNIGPSIAQRGLMAPGVDITSTIPRGGYAQLSRTSFVAPFVTGTVALLSSLFKRTTPAQLVGSVRQQMLRRSIFPPLCDAQKSKAILECLEIR